MSANQIVLISSEDERITVSREVGHLSELVKQMTEDEGARIQELSPGDSIAYFACRCRSRGPFDGCQDRCTETGMNVDVEVM